MTLMLVFHALKPHIRYTDV